jgi:hypothetical protein
VVKLMLLRTGLSLRVSTKFSNFLDCVTTIESLCLDFPKLLVHYPNSLVKDNHLCGELNNKDLLML